MYITLETLWKQGKSKAEIARLTGHDWKTVSKIIKHLKQSENYPIKKAHPKKLDAYKEKIIEWLEHNFTVIKIHEFLTKEGIRVSYSATKNYVVQLKGRHAICIRFHTLPGEEAQVDFGYAGLTLDNEGKKRKTWLFNMRLSYSRLDYFTKVYDQKVATFIDCHLQAFEFFKGIPRVVKIDNLKAAILVANFYEPIYQQLYKQFADYYGFQPVPCRVRQPLFPLTMSAKRSISILIQSWSKLVMTVNRLLSMHVAKAEENLGLVRSIILLIKISFLQSNKKPIRKKCKKSALRPNGFF